jgi:hypothetical protein
MSRGLEILRRLLLATGALVAAIGFIYGAIATFSEDDASGVLGMLGAIAAFFGWRALINWILLYEQPPQPPRPPAVL